MATKRRDALVSCRDWVAQYLDQPGHEAAAGSMLRVIDEAIRADNELLEALERMLYVFDNGQFTRPLGEQIAALRKAKDAICRCRQ